MLANKIYKYSFISIVSLFCLISAFFLALPTLVSSKWGQEKLQEYISYKTGLLVSFEDLQLSVFGPQEIRGMEIKDPKKISSLRVASISFESSFFQILFQDVLDTPLQFSNLNLVLKDSLTPIYFENVSGVLKAAPLMVKLNGTSKEGDLTGNFDLDIAFDGVDLIDFVNLASRKEMIFADATILNFKAKATNFPVAFLDSLLKTQSPHYPAHFLASMIGNKLDLTLNKSKLSQNNSLSLEVSAVAPNLTANLNLEVGPDQIFTTKPGTLMFMASQELLEHFYPQDLKVQLAAPSPLLIAIQEFHLPFDTQEERYDFSKIMFKGRLDFHEAFLKGHSTVPDIALQKFTANIETDRDSEDLFVKVQGDAKEGDKPIKVALELTLPKSLNFKKHSFPPMFIDLQHIPVAVIDHFFKLDDVLPKILGSHADLKIEALIKKDHAELAISFFSEKVVIPSIRLKVDEMWTMQEPARLIFQLNEPFVKNLLPELAPVSINTDKPLAMNFLLEPFPYFDHFEDLFHLDFKGEFKIEELALNVKATGELFSIKDILIPLEIDFANRQANLSFSGITNKAHALENGSFTGKAFFEMQGQRHLFDIALQEINPAGNKSDIALKGNVEDLLTNTGDLNIDGMSCSFDATIANLPTPHFCQVSCLDKSMHKKIEVLFGDFLNADVHVALKKLDGVVRAEVNGEEGSFNLDSTVQNGTLFLNQPFDAKFKVTPRLGTSILQDIFPVLSGVVNSDQQIVIAIQHEGFHFPLKDLDISKIEIPYAVLSLGHVKFDNSGELAKILSLLTPPDSELISVWFTPLYFTMHEGVFKLERVDMLISNQFPIATWGRVDFIADKVKMMIGMSSDALSHAFKIKDLDPGYMLQIPLIGTTDSATIDKPTATTKIGALIAQSQGGPKGLVLGAFLSIAGGALTEKTPPKPTTLPLPWENDLKKLREEPNEVIADSVKPEAVVEQPITEKKKKKKKKFNLDEQLELHADQLFEKIFK